MFPTNCFVQSARQGAMILGGDFLWTLVHSRYLDVNVSGSNPVSILGPAHSRRRRASDRADKRHSKPDRDASVLERQTELRRVRHIWRSTPFLAFHF